MGESYQFTQLGFQCNLIFFHEKDKKKVLAKITIIELEIMNHATLLQGIYTR